MKSIEAQLADQDIEFITDLVRSEYFASPSRVLAKGLDLLRTEIEENGFTFVLMGEQD